MGKDIYLFQGGDTHVRTTINQQPNDAADAARLYGEIESKAKENVENAIVRRVESINAEYVMINRDYSGYDNSYQVLFKVNGKKHTAKVEVQRYLEDPFRSTVRAIAEGIAEEVVLQLINNGDHRSFGN